uniref:NADH dehydrogenase [ubiquinone] 1 beta subcomplex subunit 2, mitochondrial n=1 Tax=Chelonoidis abingdonii TaxID=106734 RepID=A0A8C0IZU3_CHEAB
TNKGLKQPYFGRELGRAALSGSSVPETTGGGVHIETHYRQFPGLTRQQVIHGKLLSGFVWFWILWHFWHNLDTVLDEELGIPPDEEE